MYNRCTGIYKFGNNTYPQRIRRRSNLGHIFRGKSVSYGPGNTLTRAMLPYGIIILRSLLISDSSHNHSLCICVPTFVYLTSFWWDLCWRSRCKM